jgi:hypothetical protein
MWIFLRDSFLSIAQYEEEPRLLLVRGRYRGDLEKIFPEANVAEDLLGDYRFRTVIGRERVAQVLALRISQIDYLDLNDMVRGGDHSTAYDRVFGVMLEEQVIRYGAELDLPGYVPKYDLEADPEAELAVAESADPA